MMATQQPAGYDPALLQALNNMSLRPPASNSGEWFLDIGASSHMSNSSDDDDERHKLEKDLGIGNEVGQSRNNEVGKTNSALALMNKKFRMMHRLLLLANIAFGRVTMHSLYLASKINLRLTGG